MRKDSAATRATRDIRRMSARQGGSPMTCTLNGKQYIVLAISGAGYSGELLALGLPS